MKEQELREKIVDTLNATEISVELKKEDIYKFADALIANKFGRIINFAEYVGSKIAGHSNYHGDSILCALYCAAEGKEIHTVKPLDITEYGYNVLVKERDEYKHRAQVAERALDKAVEIPDYVFGCINGKVERIFTEYLTVGELKNLEANGYSLTKEAAQARLAELKGDSK